MAIKLINNEDIAIINLPDLNLFVDEEITIRLEWNSGKGGLFGFLRKAIDYDLGCFIEMDDKSLWCIDGLQFSNNRGGSRERQTRQGCFTDRPYVWHKGDDRGTGKRADETLILNPEGIGLIKRMLLYAYIYEGAPRWDEANLVVDINVAQEEPVEIFLGNTKSDKPFCTIATLDFQSKGQIKINRTVDFYTGHEQCAPSLGWPFTFSKGRK